MDQNTKPYKNTVFTLKLKFKYFTNIRTLAMNNALKTNLFALKIFKDKLF